MKKGVKDLWLKALRSGEFKQGKGRLHKGDKTCVLGVLSLLAMVDGHCTYQLKKGSGAFDGKRASLSYGIMEWAGIGQEEDDEGEKLMLKKGAGFVPIVWKGEETSLAQLNDRGKSFEELADIIDKVWRDL